MKKVLVVITFLISIVITIAHDAIHHHHDTPENIEFISGSHSDDHGHNDNDDDHHNHFPPHQHVISEGDLLVRQSTISYNKAIKDTDPDYGSLFSPYSDFDFHTYFTGFFRVFKKPIYSFTFNIPVNSTRGSPAIS